MSVRPSFNIQGSTVWACNEIVNYLKPTLEGSDESEIDKVATQKILNVGWLVVVVAFASRL